MVTYEHQCVCLLFLLQIIDISLSVRHADHKAEQKSLYVKQSPQSVLRGDSVTLQCSLLSRNEETRVQCPGEHSAFWFRAATGESRPSVIYTQSNSSCDKKRRSCVYRLSKTVKTSDKGTYYCAVDACGEILFGGGTKVQPSMFTSILISRKKQANYTLRYRSLMGGVCRHLHSLFPHTSSKAFLCNHFCSRCAMQWKDATVCNMNTYINI